MSDKIPTPIIDKNGKQTTVHKKTADVPGAARVSSVAPVAAKPVELNRNESGGIIDGGDAIFRGNHVQVRLTYIGEGYDGDFSDDGEDMPLARADVFVKPGLVEGSEPGGDDEWETPRYTNSYCTFVPANIDMEELEAWVSENGAIFDARIAMDLASDNEDKIEGDISTFLNFASYASTDSRIEATAW